MSLSPAATAARQRESAWSVHEADLGTEPVREGVFTITDEDILADSRVVIVQGVGPYTGKGTLADEATMDQLMCVAEAGSGTATVYFRVMDGRRVKGNVKFLYTVV